jgi:beta-lactamase superfamily II metal-dependent hydrolase
MAHMGLPSAEQLNDHVLSVVVFGPGFGESIAIRAETDGEPVWAIVDSARRQRRGSSVNPAVDLLVAQRARPSLVLLTHPHADHTGGMTAVIEIAAPGATIGCIEPLLETPSPHAPPEDPDDLAAISRSQTKLAHYAIRSAWATGYPKWSLLHDSTREFAGWKLTVLHPAEAEIDDAMARFQAEQDVNLNDLSASLLIERDNIALVLGADCEKVAWTAVADRMHPDDLLHTRPIKVPHHGSREAIQPVLIDRHTRDPGRTLIVTPFPRSGTLPRFEEGQGVEWLLDAGAVELTAMPGVDLVPTGTEVTLAAARQAMITQDFGGDEALQIRPQQPADVPQLRASVRDPYEAWVMLGIRVDGAVEVTRGAHAVQLVQ